MKYLKYLFIFSVCMSGVFAATMTKQMTNFNSGELSPLMKSRSDMPEYDAGAQTLQNMLINPQGPISRRPGTKYIATVKNSGQARLIPFENSVTDAYVMEFGEDYIRFYRNGAQILSGQSAYEVTTTYEDSELFELQYCQTADTMRIVHPNHPPAKLTRSAHTSWTLEDITQENGPFLKQNEDTNSTISYSIATGDYTIATSGDSYKTGDDSQGSIRANLWEAQTFTTTSAYNAAGVSLKLYRTGSPGLVTVSIQGIDGDSLPNGIDLCSGVINGDDLLTTPGQFENIYFTSFAYLSNATVYAIVVRATNGNASNSVYWREDASSPSYAGGSYHASTNSGATWTAYATTDKMFDVLKTSTSDTDGIDPNVTLNSSKEIFDANHVGALWQITHRMPGTNITGQFLAWDDDTYSQSISIPRGARYRLTTAGDWEGTVQIQRSYDDGTTWEVVPGGEWYYNRNGNVQYTGINDWKEAVYRVAWIQDATPTGYWCAYTFSRIEYINNAVVTIASYTDSNTVTATTDPNYPLAITDEATYQWAEGAWSDYRGWPRTIEMHERRMIYGGSTSYPQTVWSSVIIDEDDDYDNFTAGINDDEAWIYFLPGTNPIQWMKSMTYLMIGTANGIGRLGAEGKPLTPTFVEYKQQAKNGSAYQQAVVADNYILYLERNEKKIRELHYSLEQGGFLTPDLTILAEHITGTGIAEMDFQSRPYPQLFCVRDDGEMAVLTYDRNNEIVGWTRWVTGE